MQHVTPYDFTHKCDKACSFSTARPPCTKNQTRYCGRVHLKTHGTQ